MRDKPAEKDAGPVASFTPPPVIPLQPPLDAATTATTPKPAGPLVYDDKNDFPENAGDARCKDPIPANAKPAPVKILAMANPASLEIEIPALSVKQKLWTGATPPTECRAKLDGAVIRFHCNGSDAQTTLDGKVYVRKSDVVIGRATASGAGATKFGLPCGTPPKLEAVVCAAECKKDDKGCACGSAAK